jgi:DNA-binding transcriptional ArsR family regulator
MISKKTVNAIELCVLLAGQRGEGYMTTTDLSPRLDLSISHLENILKPLKEQGIVLSMKGPGGGYMIRGDVSLISIWDDSIPSSFVSEAFIFIFTSLVSAIFYFIFYYMLLSLYFADIILLLSSIFT